MTAVLEPDGTIHGLRPFATLPPYTRMRVVRELCHAYGVYARRAELDIPELNRLVNTTRYIAGMTLVLDAAVRMRHRALLTCPDCGDYQRGRPLSDHECPVTAALAGQE